jgi:DNA-binding GntR family transcriptional regulator
MSPGTTPPPTKASRIAADLLAGIRDGTYPGGSLLPSRARLCEQYGVSPVTARGAVLQLIEQGYVVSGRGIGTTVIAESGLPIGVRGSTQILDDLQAAIYSLNQLTVKWSEMATRDGYLDPATIHQLPHAAFDIRVLVDRLYQERLRAEQGRRDPKKR